jgi:DNA-3-methyladenine glycosylase
MTISLSKHYRILLWISNIMNLARNYRKLAPSFYHGDDVVDIARSLLGKILVTNIGDVITSGRVVETEAYNGVTDRASHAYGDRRTTRTEVMYKNGGLAYIYLCYGIHHLFNVVTNVQDIPHAVLVRAIEPMEGRDAILQRTGKSRWDDTIGSGPGNVSKALGIHARYSGTDLQGDTMWMADDGFRFDARELIATPRVGVDYAGPDALLPYRFLVKGHPQVSARSFTSKYI